MLSAMSLLFSPEAERLLAALRTDHSCGVLYERVNEMLDLIESDPTDRRVRRRRYRQPPVWGVPVSGSGHDWLILWGETANGNAVFYLGTDVA